jgi:hypothetical protein
LAITFDLEEGEICNSDSEITIDGRCACEDRMRPPHPGTFIREEILDELGLSVARTAEVLKCGEPHYPIC